jgi:hypothetical protein
LASIFITTVDFDGNGHRNPGLGLANDNNVLDRRAETGAKMALPDIDGIPG